MLFLATADRRSKRRLAGALGSVLVGFFLTMGVCSAQQTQADADLRYVLGTGDKISIQVFDEVDLTMDALVSENGFINYSYVGSIEVAGKTPQQIEEHITNILRDGYLVYPSVNVSIKEYRPFFIAGEVKAPGGYPYQPGMTVNKAVALAGGLTDRASKRKMYLKKGEGADRKSKKVSMNSTVEPGDIITINEGFF